MVGLAKNLSTNFVSKNMMVAELDNSESIAKTSIHTERIIEEYCKTLE